MLYTCTNANNASKSYQIYGPGEKSIAFQLLSLPLSGLAHSNWEKCTRPTQSQSCLASPVVMSPAFSCKSPRVVIRPRELRTFKCGWGHSYIFTRYVLVDMFICDCMRAERLSSISHLFYILCDPNDGTTSANTRSLIVPIYCLCVCVCVCVDCNIAYMRRNAGHTEVQTEVKHTHPNKRNGLYWIYIVYCIILPACMYT